MLQINYNNCQKKFIIYNNAGIKINKRLSWWTDFIAYIFIFRLVVDEWDSGHCIWILITAFHCSIGGKHSIIPY